MASGDNTAAMQEKVVTETRAVPTQPTSSDPEKQATAPAIVAAGDVFPPDEGQQTVSNNAGPESDHGADPATDSATTVVQRWCRPKGNILRLAFAFLSFFIAGMNDAAVGVCTTAVSDRYAPLDTAN